MPEIKPGVGRRAVAIAAGGVTGGLLYLVVDFVVIFACLAALALGIPTLVSGADLGTVAWWAFLVAAVRLPITAVAMVMVFRWQLVGYVLFDRVPRPRGVQRRFLTWGNFERAGTLAAVTLVLTAHLPWGWRTLTAVALVTATAQLAAWRIFTPRNRNRRRLPRHAATAEVSDGKAGDQV
jgi:hypothetical protein